MFTLLGAAQSGIDFSNDITENDSSKSFINEFGYMGGGVGIGDFNNDGLKDIFFTGNQVSCRLYMNAGANRFDDITKKAGVNTNVWATGVSIVDINNDGFDDIYVCAFGKNLLQRAKNLLFINQHNLTFTEEASAYGLADTGYSTQAVFFDYDRDGDLDMYLANYLLDGPDPNGIFPKDMSGRSPASDKLYRNDANSSLSRHPVFSDVSQEAGIREDGYGLGLVASDFNNDGWPDVYVANDFLSNDELWLNKRNGSFTNCIGSSLGHQSYSSMGADAADINNDGLADIATLDMLPEINERKKLSFSFMNYDRYQAERAAGYEPEFTRNMLQLNNGNYSINGSSIPFFSEIGQMAGISATDWSWSVLMADFDGDGWKDIHITNGIGRDFINADFLEFSNSIFSNTKDKTEQRKLIRNKLASLHHIELGNYLFLNNRNYTFSDVSQKAGIGEKSMSNGAAYVDIDNDGDLDLVVNNINRKAYLLLNNTIQKSRAVSNHYLAINLEGDRLNPHGFGAKVMVYTNGKGQMQEQNPVRGYFSCVDQKLIFGMGKNVSADSVVALWPGNRKQVISHVKLDTVLIISYRSATGFNTPGSVDTETVFSDAHTETNILYQHVDHPFNDFAKQRLLPQKFSQLGPFITTGDVNGDGLTDFFVGGAFNFSGKVFIQQSNGTFTSHNLTDSVKLQEDLNCLLFDADNDKDPDLLVTSGDFRFGDNPQYTSPRLYRNDGKGNFTIDKDAIPPNVHTIAGCVSRGDYDADGFQDVFIGGRVSANYPLSPRSFLLKNNNGIFQDVTASVCPPLQNAGMITAGVWSDFNQDGTTDLIIAGEWMAIRFFKNNRGRLQEVSDSAGLSQTRGMWRSLAVADMDNDGDADLVTGNLGLNCNYHVSVSEPMKLFAQDMDGNGIIDPILFYYIKDDDGSRRLFPSISRGQLADQVPFVKKNFLYNKDFAHATFEDIFKTSSPNEITSFTCEETRSCYFENRGNGKFVKHPLPQEAQFAPVNAIICDDVDKDGFPDLLLAGNEYQADVVTGRYDASFGCYLRGGKLGTFTAVTPAASGFIVHGDVKDMKTIGLGNGNKMVLAAINNDSLKVFKIKK